MVDPKIIIKLLRSAALIPPSRAIRPELGDIVVELTTFDPDPTMIGTLEKIEEDNARRVFYVRTLSGEMQRWGNAEAVTIQFAASAHYQDRLDLQEAPRDGRRVWLFKKDGTMIIGHWATKAPTFTHEFGWHHYDQECWLDDDDKYVDVPINPVVGWKPLC